MGTHLYTVLCAPTLTDLSHLTTRHRHGPVNLLRRLSFAPRRHPSPPFCYRLAGHCGHQALPRPDDNTRCCGPAAERHHRPCQGREARILPERLVVRGRRSRPAQVLVHRYPVCSRQGRLRGSLPAVRHRWARQLPPRLQQGWSSVCCRLPSPGRLALRLREDRKCSRVWPAPGPACSPHLTYVTPTVHS